MPPPASGTGTPPSVCPSFDQAGQAPPRQAGAAGWGFGCAAIDRALAGGGLAGDGLHEIKPAGWPDNPTAILAGLALAARQARLRARPLLWVLAGRAGGDLGRPYGPGLAALGLPPGRLLLVEAVRAGEALWAVEEGLRSGALAAVLGSLAEVPPLAARRLLLAAAAGRTACLMVTGHATGGMLPAHTRWRVAAAASGPRGLDPAAPGDGRLRLGLERCRQGGAGGTWIVEWCDDAHAFRLAAPLAAGAPAAGGARRRAG